MPKKKAPPAQLVLDANAAPATALVLAAESAFGVWLMGRAFGRVDVVVELGQ